MAKRRTRKDRESLPTGYGFRLTHRDYFFGEVAGGEHNEAAWSARFDKVLLYFFGV